MKPVTSGQPKAVPAQKEKAVTRKNTNTMPASTVESVAEVALRMALAVKGGDIPAALDAVAYGAEHHPDAVLEEGATWAKLEAVLKKRLAGTASVAEKPKVEQVKQVKQSTAKRVARTKAASGAASVAVAPPPVEEPKVEPVQVVAVAAPVALRIEHTIADGTRLFGSEKGELGKRISAIMSKDGQGWWFYQDFWYIRGSRPGGADMARIQAAEQALRGAGFAVTLDIHTTDENGDVVPPKALKPRVPKAGKAHLKARAERLNSINWHLSHSEGGLPCSEACGTVGLTLATARVVDDPETNMPVAKCAGCAGEAVVLELPAEPVSPIVVAEKRDDDRPKAMPRREYPRVLVTVAGEGDKREEDSAPLAGLDLEALILLVKVGDVDAADELRRRLGDAAPGGARRAASAARKATAKTATRVAKTAEPKPVDVDGVVVMRFAYEEDAHPKHTGSAVRRELNAKVANIFRKWGVVVQVNDGRKSGKPDEIEVRLISSAAGNKRAEITNKAVTAVRGVRGVGSPVAVN